MPIFEYICNGCSKEFEELVPSADSEVHCPECGSTDAEKLFSPFAKSCSSCGSCGTPT
ncbi:MAG: zinc ribbon domain-containing protein [bacterium]|nr:MAG: zinc ribbon domain-containing protein [bacterium]